MKLYDDNWKKIVIKWTSSKTVRTKLYLTEQNSSPKKVSIDTFMLLFLELLSFVKEKLL